jgi:hypothetical protein
MRLLLSGLGATVMVTCLSAFVAPSEQRGAAGIPASPRKASDDGVRQSSSAIAMHLDSSYNLVDFEALEK